MLNKVMLIGNLGADPDSRFLPNGNAVTNISLATTMRWKDKTTGEKKESTEWHRVVFFNRLAEVVSEYLRKGSQVHIEGRLQTRKWLADDGSDRYSTEIVASDMIMLGAKQGSVAPAAAAAGAGAGATAQAPRHSAGKSSANDQYDDVPF